MANVFDKYFSGAKTETQPVKKSTNVFDKYAIAPKAVQPPLNQANPQLSGINTSNNPIVLPVKKILPPANTLNLLLPSANQSTPQSTPSFVKTPIQVPKPNTDALVFKLGENLKPAQTLKAKEVVKKTDVQPQPSENVFNKYFEDFKNYAQPKPGEVRTVDVLREARNIVKKAVGPDPEDIKKAMESRTGTAITKSGALLRVNKLTGEYSQIDPTGAMGELKNVAKEGLDAIGKTLLKNIAKKEIVPEVKSLSKILPMAESALHIPGKNVYAKVTPEQFDMLKNEIKNIPFTKGDMPHLTNIDKLNKAGVKEIPVDEIRKLSQNIDEAFKPTGKGVGGLPIPEEKTRLTKEAQAVADELIKTFDNGIKKSLPKNNNLKKKLDTSVDLVNSDGSLKDVMRNWLKNTYKGKAEAEKEALAFKIKEDVANLGKHEASLDYEGRELVQKKFDELYKKANDAGITLEKRGNYIPHVYNQNPQEIAKAVEQKMAAKGVDQNIIDEYLAGKELPPEISKSLKMNPFFSKERSFDTYADAAEYGLTPKYEKMSQLVGHYTEKMNDAIANKKLVDELIDKGHLSLDKRKGMIPVNLPGEEGYFAQPKIAGYLNDYFRNEDALNILQKGVKYGAIVNKGLQGIVLAGGPPKTNINAFTFGHVIKSLTTGVGNVLTGDLKGAGTQFKALSNVVRSNFTKQSIKWFSGKVESGIMVKIANEGINMGDVVGSYKETNRGFINFFKKTENKKIFGEGYHRLFDEKTFNSFLPMQTVTVFEDTYKAAIKKGLPESEASKLAGDLTKKFMGFSDNLRGKTAGDTLSTFAFAVRFREGLINTYWNTIKSLSPAEWNNPAFSQNRKLIMGMTVSFLGYDYLNQKLNGHHIWENPAGKKMELMIPGKDGKIYYTPFMPSQLAFFRNAVEGAAALKDWDTKTAVQKVGSNLAMGLKLTTDIIGNKDYFGNEIYDSQAPGMEQLSAIAKYVGQNANHPYIKGVWNLVLNANAKSQKIYPTYDKISKLIDDNKREEADLIIAGLSPEDKKAYQEMKQEKLKPTAQVMSEMIEVPLRFSSLGKIKAQEYYQKIDDISREVKALPEGTDRTKKLQEYMINMPEADRRGMAYALGQNGISTKGLKLSDDTIEADKVYNELKALTPDEANARYEKIAEEKPKVAQYVREYVREGKLTQEERDMKDLNVEDRASLIWEKLKKLSTKDEKNNYIQDLNDKGIISDNVFDRLKELKESGR